MLPSSVTEVIAIIALCLSIFNTLTKYKFGKNRNKLTEQHLEKEAKESENDKKADFSAIFVTHYRNDHKLQICNIGKSVARNINIEFIEGDDVFIESEIKEIFPFKSLEKGHSIKLIAAFSLMSRPKYLIRLTWDDDFSKNNTKEICIVR